MLLFCEEEIGFAFPLAPWIHFLRLMVVYGKRNRRILTTTLI